MSPGGMAEADEAACTDLLPYSIVSCVSRGEERAAPLCGVVCRYYTSCLLLLLLTPSLSLPRSW